MWRVSVPPFEGMGSKPTYIPNFTSQTEEKVDLYAEIDGTDASQQEKGRLKKWIHESKSKRLEILLTGRCGSGKSSLVNCLLQEKRAMERHGVNAMTKEVSSYTITTKDHFEIVVWDSPGLCDGSKDERRYLAEIKEKCSNVDLIIYCINAATTRLALLYRPEETYESDLSAIQKLTKTLGVEMWSHAVFVLTFGNKLEALLKCKHPSSELESKLKEKIENWRTGIREALKYARVPQEVVINIPIEPAGHACKRHLPGWNHWLGVLWFTLVSRASKASVGGVSGSACAAAEATVSFRQQTESNTWTWHSSRSSSCGNQLREHVTVQERHSFVSSSSSRSSSCGNQLREHVTVQEHHSFVSSSSSRSSSCGNQLREHVSVCRSVIPSYPLAKSKLMCKYSTKRGMMIKFITLYYIAVTTYL